MSIETQKIFDYLYHKFSWGEARSKLPSIFNTFACCSYDAANDRYIVNSKFKAINFDKLTMIIIPLVVGIIVVMILRWHLNVFLVTIFF